MKRTVYTSFACKEKITVESTAYKGCDGLRIWTDGIHFYNLNNSGRHHCIRNTTWVANRLVDDVIENAEKYGTHIS